MRNPIRSRRSAVEAASDNVAPTSAQIAQNLALAALVGGNLYGRLAMHPALTEVSDKQERGKVLNRAWRRYGNVNSSALAVLVGGWLLARREASGGVWTSPARRRLRLAKDIAVGAVAGTGVASAVAGVGFAQQAPGGAVPMESGSTPAAETPARAAAIKRLVNVLSRLNLGAELGLLVVDVMLGRSRR